jgi:nickel-dependent lactate racemase
MATMAEADFSINALINAEHRLAGVFCGDLLAAHAAACSFAERHCLVRTEQPFDIVVTTAAGYPLDTTYYQAVKGLVGALGILAPAGGIVLASECSKGIGSPEFRAGLERLERIGEHDEFVRHISDARNFTIDQWEVEMLVKALRRGDVYLVSGGIPPEDRHLTCATWARSVEEALSHACAGRRNDVRIAVIPEGPYAIPVSDECVKRVPGSTWRES